MNREPQSVIRNPSFDVRLLAIQERSRWSMRGFNERVIRWEVPQALDKADVEAVAWAMFPDTSPKDKEWENGARGGS